MTIDQVYTLTVPVVSDDGQSSKMVQVTTNVRVQSESEVAAQIASNAVAWAIQKSIYCVESE